jgi:glutamate N-acetyltransferase/amino-acid N-acetyltransferase
MDTPAVEIPGLKVERYQYESRTSKFDLTLTAVEIEDEGVPVKIGAIAKGAGMICPNMATMFCFITTDAAIEQSALRKALCAAVDASFNCITVDGDMSTSDTVLILANGQAGN